MNDTTGFAHPLTYPLHYRARKRGWVRVLMRCTVDLPVLSSIWRIVCFNFFHSFLINVCLVLDGWTVLYVHSVNGHNDIVQVLMNLGVQVDFRNWVKMQCIVRPCVVSREIGNLSLSRILKLTKGRMIYAMISVTSRNTAAEEEMLRIFIKGQLRKDHIAIILLTSTTIDLTRNMVTMKSSTRRFTILWNGIWEIL